MLKTKKSLLLNVSLLFASIALFFTLLESVFRIKSYYEGKKTLHEAFKHQIDMPADGHATLAHIIKLSADEKIIYELKPGIALTYKGALTTTNQDGFRDKNYTLGKKENTIRIIGIGDSLMIGQGVTDGKDYLSLLEEQLNAHYSEKNWEIINTAVPGYNTVMEIETLKKKGLKYKPDIVIVGFCSNDLDLPNFIRTAEKNYLTLKKFFLFDFIYNRYRKTEMEVSTVPILQKIGLDAAPKRKENPHFFEGDSDKVPGRYKNMVGWNAYIEAMNELKKLSEREKFEVMVTFLASDKTDRDEKAMKISSELGFHVIDIGLFLKEYMYKNNIPKYLGSALSLSATDGHPSALGHKLTSEEILKYMIAKNILKKYMPTKERI